MSKSGNGFYISSVISRASRWASWVFILQTPNLDLPAHVDEGVKSDSIENQNELGICFFYIKFSDEHPQTNEKYVLPGSTRVLKWACFKYMHVQIHFHFRGGISNLVGIFTFPISFCMYAFLHFTHVWVRKKTWVWFPSHMVSIPMYMFFLNIL